MTPRPTPPAAPGPVWAPLTSATDVERATGLAWLSGLGHNRAAPADLLLRLLDAGTHDVLHRDDLPEEVVDAAIAHPGRRVRIAVAESGRLTPAQWDRLIAATPGSGLRGLFTELAGAARKPSPGDALPPADPADPAELAATAAATPDIGPGSGSAELRWVTALHADAEAMRLLAASPKLLVRRSVARAPRLPADVADLLARDEDRVVRIFLAESCDDAPPWMLLDMAAWWDGTFSFPGRPRNHPNFPREGLLRLAADPNPRLRAAALDDPATTCADVERAAADPDPVVRRAAAGHRRLAPATAAALTADDDRDVRWLARTNPALPPEDLVALLLDPRGAATGARNPAVPGVVMHRMVDLALAHAGIPPAP
ncbi:hypothetical protein ACFVUY_30680 [Kitasatospora sp. NPDC058063]|uniref:hypothetical protein n=1 Tax=unclassified Kitasatospora TaxID=2633591 RepID=UPI0036DBD4F3